MQPFECGAGAPWLWEISHAAASRPVACWLGLWHLVFLPGTCSNSNKKISVVNYEFMKGSEGGEGMEFYYFH